MNYRVILGILMGLVSVLNGPARAAGELHYLNLSQQARQGGLWLQFKSDDARDWFTRFSEPGREPERSTLSMHQQIGNQMLHWGVAQSDREQLNQLGVTFGSTSIYGFSGNGDTVSTIFNPYAAVGSFQFHGGLRQHFDYSGYRFGYRLRNQSSIGLTHAMIKAPGLEDRSVYDLGWSGRALQLSLSQVDVGGQLAGRVLSIGAQRGHHRLSLQGFSAENKSTYVGLGYTARNRNGKEFAINLERRRNPLYEGANDNRLTFSLGFRFGGATSAFHAAETENTEGAEEQPEKKKVSPVLIGAGVVGVGLALSSGSSSADGQSRLEFQHESAKTVLNSINPTSVAQNREYGGYIYRNADGTYSATTPIRGEAASVSLPAPASVAPAGAVTTASYHTHAAFDPAFDNENFSPQDILSDILFSLDGYLATPMGQFKFFNETARRVVTLGGPGTIATGL